MNCLGLFPSLSLHVPMFPQVHQFFFLPQFLSLLHGKNEGNFGNSQDSKLKEKSLLGRKSSAD